MHFETDYRLEEFILNTRWEDLPEEVRERMKGCFVDLMGALVIGSRSRQFEAGLRLAGARIRSGRNPGDRCERALWLHGGGGRDGAFLQCV